MGVDAADQVYNGLTAENRYSKHRRRCEAPEVRIIKIGFLILDCYFSIFPMYTENGSSEISFKTADSRFAFPVVSMVVAFDADNPCACKSKLTFCALDDIFSTTNTASPL